MRPGWLRFLAAVMRHEQKQEVEAAKLAEAPEAAERDVMYETPDGSPNRAEEITLRAAREGKPIEMRVTAVVDGRQVVFSGKLWPDGKEPRQTRTEAQAEAQRLADRAVDHEIRQIFEGALSPEPPAKAR